MKILTNKLYKINCKIVFLCTFLYPVIFLAQLNGQTVSVHGRVVSSRIPVKQSSVTFIDNSDTTNKFSAFTDDSGNYLIDIPTSVESYGNNLPDKFELEQNYPNPFSSSTAIPYNIKKQSDDIHITIYDILGREVKRFTVGFQSTGIHSVLWDGKNNFGQKVTNGVYLYKLQVGDESRVKKMVFNSGIQNFISLPHTNFSPKLNSGRTINVKGTTYTARVENTVNTTPFIVETEVNDISINNDTTINFSVDYITSAAADPDSLHQIIRGFGASNIILWRPDMTDSEIQTAFGTGDGQLGFTILRIMLEADSTRWGLYVSTAKKAYEMGAIIIAVPWFAPAELIEVVDGEQRVRYDKYGEYAAHLNSFGKFMASNGVPLYGVSLQNELDIGEWTHWSADEMFTFVRDYAQVIEGPKVMGPESFKFDRAYSDPILNDSVACANLDIVSGHIYGGGIGKYPLAEEKGKEVWMTEYLINSPGDGENMDTSLASAIATAKSISDCMNANMSTYVWWYIVRYYGPIADGTLVNKGRVTRKGYVMSQFARFIRPGDYRIECSVFPTTSGVYVSAYKNISTSKVVIVAVNSNASSEDVAFTFKNGTISTLTPYQTTLTKNVEQGDDITINNNKSVITLASSSVTTFVSN